MNPLVCQSIAEPHHHSDALTGPPFYNAPLHSGDMRQRGLCFGSNWFDTPEIKPSLVQYHIRKTFMDQVIMQSFISFYVMICKGLNVAFSFTFISSIHLISFSSGDKRDNQGFLTTGESQTSYWYDLQIICPPSIPQGELLEFCLFADLLSWLILGSWCLVARTSYYVY